MSQSEGSLAPELALPANDTVQHIKQMAVEFTALAAQIPRKWLIEGALGVDVSV